MPTTTARVTPGMQFRSLVHDESVLFEVARHTGRGVWMCRAVNEPFVLDGTSYDSDHAGMEKPFTSGEILSAVRWAENVNAFMNAHDDWWANVPVGTTLHYDNGFEQYVRGVVVEKDGVRMLRPTALIGNVIPVGATAEERVLRGWNLYDLARRDDAGVVHYGYHVSKVFDGTAWQPNISCVVEAPGYNTARRKVDPRGLEPIDLHNLLPDPDGEKLADEAKHRTLRMIGEYAARHDMTADERLAAITDILTVHNHDRSTK